MKDFARTVRRASGARFLLAAFLAASLVPASPSRAQSLSEFESQREVRNVEIEGNVAFSDRRLRGLLRTHGSSFLRPWRHNPYRTDFMRIDRAALQSFYRRRGYLEAQVDSVRADPVPGSGSKVDVHFFLTEGPLSRLKELRLAGMLPLSDAEVRKVLKQRIGDPADIGRIETDRLAIEDLYANLGYAAVDVRDSLEADSASVAVVYRIDPGVIVRVGQVGVEGIKSTRRKVVTRELTLHTGDVLSREKLVKSQQRIYDTGLYSDVFFERGDIDSTTRIADLLVTVRERKMAGIDVGVGYGTVDKVRLTTEWSHRNLGHEGIRFSVGGRTGIAPAGHPFSDPPKLRDRRADVSLTQPWTLGTRTRTTLGAYAEQVTRYKENIGYPYRAYGAAVTFRRDIWKYTQGLLSLEQRWVITDTAQAFLGRRYTTRRVTVQGERDSRRDLFDPKFGSDVLANVVVAGGVLAGDARFVKPSIAASTYRPLPRRVTLALRMRAGLAMPFGRRSGVADTLQDVELIPVDDRFVTGGATTVRGYFEREIGSRIEIDSTGAEHSAIQGGAVLLLGSVEARFPLIWVITGAVFLDAGNVWERPRDITLQRVFTVTGGNAGYSDMRYSVGGGIRIGTPVGPVRFDYGWKLRHAKREERDLSSTRGVFHFSLGQAF